MEVHYDIFFKVLVVGDVAVGKTALIKRSVHNIFSTNYKTTIGVDFAIKELDIDDVHVRIQLWDMAGQERFGNMTRVYYKEASGALVVYDVSRVVTYCGAGKWIQDLKSKLETPIPIVVLANKSDLPNDCVDLQEAIDTHLKDWVIDVVPVSAKNNVNIQQALETLCKVMVQDHKPPKPKKDVVDLQIVEPIPKKGCCK